MWKKVIYISAVVIFGIIFYMMSYVSNYSAHQMNVVSEAIQTKEYYKVPELFLDHIPMDKNPSTYVENEKIDFTAYPVVGEIGFEYVTDEKTVTESAIEYAYYFYLFDFNYTISTQENSNGQQVNKSAIRFINGDQAYDYYFVVNSSINSSVYKETVSSKEEYLFNSERDLTQVIVSWGFAPSVFCETAINYIENQIGGDINKIALTDSFGNVVFESAIDLDFKESFFNHSYIAEHKAYYNANLEKIATESALGNTEMVEEIKKEMSNYLEQFINNFSENTQNTTFIVTPTSQEKIPESIFWQSLGMLGLFLLAMLIIYVILFHFKKIKQLFSRSEHKDYSQGVNKNKRPVNQKPVAKQVIKEKDNDLAAEDVSVEESKAVEKQEEIQSENTNAQAEEASIDNKEE